MKLRTLILCYAAVLALGFASLATVITSETLRTGGTHSDSGHLWADLGD